jgi:hypothetical protein
MDLFNNNRTGVIVSFLLASILVMVWYGFYIIHADNYFMSMWGDAFKNYYTFAYYVNFDHGTHFTGMNYPFGEHVVFTDGQPALEFLFRPLCQIGFVKQHLHAFFTIVTFLSLPVCASVLYLIFAEYETKGIYAIISAVFITMLSPQLPRLTGHFGMGYCFIIPFSFFLLIRASKTGRTIYLILFSVSVTVFGLLHIYHLAIITFFALAYAVLYYLAGEKNKVSFIFFIKQAIAALAPFIFIKVFMFLTDPITDRPDNPWGFFDTCSSYDTVFLMPYSFIYQFITRYVNMPNAAGERWSYIGIVADMLLIFFIVSSILRFSLARRIFKGTSISLPVALGASVILLLFSFGLPFTIDGCKWLFDYMGPVKQFRAPCRFAWAFYYVSNIFLVVYVYRFLSIINIRIWIRRGLAICMFTLWFIDLNVVNNRIVSSVSQYAGMLDMKNEQIKVNRVLQSGGFSARDFQSLLYLPYFTMGSEKTAVIWGGDVMGMKISLYTGLKMIDAEMSRTSLSQANMNAQLTSSVLLHKEVLKLYPTKSPILVAVAIHETTTPNEQALIKKGTYIGSSYVFPDTIRFYSLPLKAFDDTAGVIRSRFDGMMADMYKHRGYLSSDSADDVVTKTYDEISAPFVRFGRGALYVEAKDTTLYEGVLPAAKDSSLYEFSIWNYSDHRVPSYPWYQINIYGPDHAQIAQYEMLASASRDVFENWKRTNITFILPSKHCTVKITGRGNFASYDELMIRPANLEVLTHSRDTSLFMYNNYPIQR